MKGETREELESSAGLHSITDVSGKDHGPVSDLKSKNFNKYCRQ